VTSDRRRASWLGLYVVLVIALPGLALAADQSTTPRSWTDGVSRALAFEAFVILLVQFAMVSRLRPVSLAFGSDALTRLHRNLALLAFAFLVAHPLLLAAGRDWHAWSPIQASSGLAAGAAAFWATVVIIATSLWRSRFRLSYEAWQIVHLAAACLLIGAALAHALLLGRASQSPAVRMALVAYAALFVILLIRYRLIRPLILARRPWTVVTNTDAGGDTRLLRLRPDGHAGFDFQPGQFAWLATAGHPLRSGQHPLSMASSDRRRDDGSIEFAIKGLGDWSRTVVPALRPGQRVYVDGPFGAFTPDLEREDPLVLIAGGIGIAPIRAMLLALRDRQDQRRIVLFYAAADRSRVICREDIETLARVLNLDLVYVFERPGDDWAGERGYVTADMLRRHLPGGAECFVCGPVPMMDRVERMLLGLGVAPSRIHAERYQMV
jgi:predicted ferric reductase